MSEIPSDENIVQEALRRFKLANEVEANQRRRENDDLRFQVPEFQWADDARQAREGSKGDSGTGGVPVPPRPILSIPKLDQPIQLVQNQAAAAHLGVNIHPISEDADDDTAEILQGLYRDIERNSRANLARLWAFDRASKAGRGFYRVMTEWDDESGNATDQKIVIRRILDQRSVLMDPASTEPDFSDAEWAFVTSWVPYDTFKAQYPDAKIGDDTEFDAAYQQAPEWVRGVEEGKSVRVAEYFRKFHKRSKVYVLPDGSVSEKKPKGDSIERERDDVTVRWYKLTASDELDSQDWNGKHIPIVPVIGKELQMFDAERRWQGMVGPAKDAQRLFNYAASSAVELAALEPKAPYVGVEGQFEGHEAAWQQANVRNFPYLEHRPVMVGGQMAPPPQRTQIDSSRLGPSMMLLQQADSFIQAATSTFDPALGNFSERERSGRAILALQSQADAGNSQYLTNLAEISMTYEAKVVLDLIPKIYDRPGRVARILDLEGEAQTVMLNAPFRMDEQSGRPVMEPRMMTGPGMPPLPAQRPEGVNEYDLTKGRYGVSVTIGKSYQTRIQQGADEIGQLLAGLPPELQIVVLPLYFKFRDFPGAQEISKLLTKLRDKQFPNLTDEGEQPSPEQMKAMLERAEQEKQALVGQLQQAMKALETEQVKQAATLQKSKQDAEVKVALETLKSQAQVALQRMEQHFEAAQQAMEQRFEARQAELDRAHEMALEAMKSATADRRAEEMAERGLEGGPEGQGGRE